MYESLYSILNPLIVQSKTGHLTLTHENGKTAKIIIRESRIINVETDTLSGTKAFKDVSMWVFFDHEFIEEQTSLDASLTHTDSENYLAFLAKVEKQYIKIRETVSFDDYLFKFLASKVEGNINFKQNELQVALALDGKATIKDIAQKTKLPDLLVLSHVLKMLNLGLVQKISSDSATGTNEAETFIVEMTKILTGYVGPAAEFIVDEVLKDAESTPEILRKNGLPQIIASISEQLDEGDVVPFKKWALENIPKTGDAR